jgi:hypothetical protein
MIQLYFLSVLCNGLSGYILFTEDNDKEDELGVKSPVSVNSPTFHLVLGIISIVTAVLKILSPTASSTGKSIFLFGDLLPVAAGLIAGLLLIFGIYRQSASSPDSENTGSLDRFAVTLLASRKVVGIMLLAVAIIHFIFAGLPLL